MKSIYFDKCHLFKYLCVLNIQHKNNFSCDKNIFFYVENKEFVANFAEKRITYCYSLDYH